MPMIAQRIVTLVVSAPSKRIFPRAALASGTMHADSHDAVVRRLRITDDLARVVTRGDEASHEFVERELFGPADLEDAVHRCPRGDASHGVATSSAAIGWIIAEASRIVAVGGASAMAFTNS